MSEVMRTINPATGELIKEWRFQSDESVERALEEGQEAFHHGELCLCRRALIVFACLPKACAPGG